MHIAPPRTPPRPLGRAPVRGFQATPPQRGRFIRLVIMGVAAGYFTFGRTFAYLGIPGLYPGEILLLAAAAGRYGWLHTCISVLRSKPSLAIAALLFLLWGCAEGVRGYVAGYPLIDIVEGLPAHYYPLLLFAGIAVWRLLSVAKLKRYYMWLTFLTGLSGIAFTVTSNQGIVPTLPWGSGVALLSGAALPPFCLLAYIALSRQPSLAFFLACTPAAAAILIGGRGSILGALCGLLTLLPRRRKLIVSIAVPGLAVLAVISVFSELLPDLGGRTGRATPAWVAARVISVFDANSAAQIAQGSDEDEGALELDAGTADWRRHLWADSIASLATTSDWLIGHGYGPVLGDLLPGETGSGYTHDLRTPHNFGIYLLAYTGLIGAALYLALLVAIAFELSRCPASHAKDAAIACGVCTIAMAVSGNLLETPFGAVPAYCAVGTFLAAAWAPQAARAAVRSRPAPGTSIPATSARPSVLTS